MQLGLPPWLVKTSPKIWGMIRVPQVFKECRQKYLSIKEYAAQCEHRLWQQTRLRTYLTMQRNTRKNVPMQLPVYLSIIRKERVHCEHVLSFTGNREIEKGPKRSGISLRDVSSERNEHGFQRRRPGDSSGSFVSSQNRSKFLSLEGKRFQRRLLSLQATGSLLSRFREVQVSL